MSATTENLEFDTETHVLLASSPVLIAELGPHESELPEEDGYLTHRPEYSEILANTLELIDFLESEEILPNALLKITVVGDQIISVSYLDEDGDKEYCYSSEAEIGDDVHLADLLEWGLEVKDIRVEELICLLNGGVDELEAADIEPLVEKDEYAIMAQLFAASPETALLLNEHYKSSPNEELDSQQLNSTLADLRESTIDAIASLLACDFALESTFKVIILDDTYLLRVNEILPPSEDDEDNTDEDMPPEEQEFWNFVEAQKDGICIEEISLQELQQLLFFGNELLRELNHDVLYAATYKWR